MPLQTALYRLRTYSVFINIQISSRLFLSQIPRVRETDNASHFDKDAQVFAVRENEIDQIDQVRNVVVCVNIRKIPESNQQPVSNDSGNIEQTDGRWHIVEGVHS